MVVVEAAADMTLCPPLKSSSRETSDEAKTDRERRRRSMVSTKIEGKDRARGPSVADGEANAGTASDDVAKTPVRQRRMTRTAIRAVTRRKTRGIS